MKRRILSALCALCMTAALAAQYGVSPENVFLSNGSDDILNFCFMAFGRDGALFPEITYGFYEVFCALHGIKERRAPMREGFSLRPEDFFGAGSMVVIANPNAQTGVEMPPEGVEAIVRNNPDNAVVIDEAYVAFGGTSALPLVRRYPNLVVVRTFSKSRSMAGARLGFAVGDAGLIADKTVEVDASLKPEYIDSAAELLNKVFVGRRADELAEADIESEIAGEIEGFRDIFDTVLAIIRSYVREHSDDDVAVEGALKMLDYPEYDVADAKNFLSVLSDRSSVSELLEDTEDSIEFSVRIGKEDSGVDKCAIITAAYRVGDEVVGRAGVIGPERMDYKKVIGVLDYIKKALGTVLDDDKDNE